MVDFPAPFSPIRPWTVPFLTVRSIPSRTLFFAKDFESFFISSTTLSSIFSSFVLFAKSMRTRGSACQIVTTQSAIHYGLVLQLVKIISSGVCLDHVDSITIEAGEVGELIQTG